MKNLKNIMLLVLAMAMVLCLCACGESENKGDETTESTAATTQETTEATTDDSKVTYTVTVVDEQGNPVSGVMVQMCLDACIPAITNAEGVATWSLEEADYQVSFVNIPEGYAQDANKYSFESGSYELTLTLQKAAAAS